MLVDQPNIERLNDGTKVSSELCLSF